ncbi:anhydro-N-acetylmuramic acid kinase [Soonwooa sp.]|uniref:anhydro-N-acetylmuramic acid kinase n=1 Tax=Soonwooa sp. TaxID=1938592 RepID=UPI0028AAAA9E|nr:anhydro-N-acetylmuramic acid kinase [Soonwooa sp.]
MATSQDFFALGLMSGTSLDGLDLCYSKFWKSDEKWHFEILETETIAYSEAWENKLRNAVKLNADALLALNSDYGFLLGELSQNFISKHNIKNLDVIGSHGHTIFHQPEKKMTLQIGDGRAIQILTKKNVVYDFRMQDVLMGGSGAPLVPIGDELLFSEVDACVNLGGFSNISFKKDEKRIGYDICPVNIILNYFAKKQGQNFDKDGELAKQGTVDSELLMKLNNIEFYQLSEPKSLGYEWVESHVMPLLKDFSDLEILATFTEHAAKQIAINLNQNNIKKALFTGGGSHNTYLIEKIKTKTKTQIIIPNKEIIDYKEALIFAFMAVLKTNGDINILSSVTGSSHDHSSGIFLRL